MYPTLQDFQREKRITLPKPHKDWRLVKDFPTGEISGIPTMRGKAIATNGITVFIESESGVVMNGHFAHFVKDKKERESGNSSNDVEGKHRKSVFDILEGFSLD